MKQKTKIRFFAHICSGGCNLSPTEATQMKASGYDDAFEKFANAFDGEIKDQEIHVFRYCLENNQFASYGHFGRLKSWRSK